MRSYSSLNFVAANSFEALWIFSGFARNFKVNKSRAALLTCLVICHRAIYSVNTFTRYSEGALRLIRLCGGASYEYQTQEPDPGVFRPSRFDPFRRYWRIYCIRYRARRNHSRSRLLPLQSARLLRLANYWEESRQSSFASSRLSLLPLVLPVCATSSSDRKVSLVFPSSCLRKGTIFLCTRVISEK